MVGERVVKYNGNPFCKDGETEGDGNSFSKEGAKEEGAKEGATNVGNSFPFAHLVASSLEVKDLDYPN